MSKLKIVGMILAAVGPALGGVLIKIAEDKTNIK